MHYYGLIVSDMVLLFMLDVLSGCLAIVMQFGHCQTLLCNLQAALPQPIFAFHGMCCLPLAQPRVYSCCLMGYLLLAMYVYASRSSTLFFPSRQVWHAHVPARCAILSPYFMCCSPACPVSWLFPHSMCSCLPANSIIYAHCSCMWCSTACRKGYLFCLSGYLPACFTFILLVYHNMCCSPLCRGSSYLIHL